MRTIFSIALIFWLTPFAMAQAIRHESVEKIMRMKNDTTKTNVIYDTANAYIANGRYRDALWLVEKGETLLKKITHPIACGKIYFIKGKAYDYLGVTDSAVLNYRKAIKYYTKAKRWRGVGGAHMNIGILYSFSGKQTEALVEILTASRFFEKIDNKKGVLAAYSNAAGIYFNMHDFKKALFYFRNVINRCENTAEFQHQLSTAYFNIGNSHFSLGSYDSAEFYYQKANHIFEKENDEQSMADVMLAMGPLERVKGNYKKALNYYQTALTIKRKTDAIWNREVYINMSVLFMHLKKYRESGLYLDTAWNLYSKDNQLRGQANVLEHRADLYSRMGKYNLAYAEHLKFKEFYDSLYNETRLHELSDIKTGYEVDKKERELNEKKKIEIAKMNERKRLEVKQLNEKAASDRFVNLIIIISILVVLAIILVFSYVLYKRFTIIKTQKLVIEKQKQVVEEKNKEVMDSIHYAKRIQRSLLPSEKYIAKKLKGKG